MDAFFFFLLVNSFPILFDVRILWTEIWRGIFLSNCQQIGPSGPSPLLLMILSLRQLNRTSAHPSHDTRRQPDVQWHRVMILSGRYCLVNGDSMADQHDAVLVKFARYLASNEKKHRDRTVLKLKKWLQVKCKGKSGKFIDWWLHINYFTLFFC